MKIKFIVTALILSLALPAIAQFKAVSEAYEVSLKGFQAPTHEAGGVVFRPCSKCELKRLRVTATTRYAVNGETVRLEDFRRTIETAPDPDEVAVTVLHHLDSNTIEMLDAWL